MMKEIRVIKKIIFSLIMAHAQINIIQDYPVVGTI